MEIPTPVCALVRNDSVVRNPHFPLQIHNLRTTERYRAGQVGNENRPRSSRLGCRPCRQIPICRSAKRRRQKKAGLRCKKGAIPPSKRGNTPEPSADGSGVVHKPRGTLLTPFTCHTQSGRSLTREIFSWFWNDREADRMRATKRYRAGGAARSESKS